MVFFHHLESVAYGGTALYGNGIVDHAVFGTLYGMDLTGLLLDRHILMDYTDTTFTGYGDGHFRFCDRIHGRRYNRDVQGYTTGKTGGKIHFAGKHIGKRGDKKDVVECEAVHLHSVCKKR